MFGACAVCFGSCLAQAPGNVDQAGFVVTYWHYSSSVLFLCLPLVRTGGEIAAIWSKPSVVGPGNQRVWLPWPTEWTLPRSRRSLNTALDSRAAQFRDDRQQRLHWLAVRLVLVKEGK